MDSTAKPGNKTVYYAIDAIQTAIHEQRAISFERVTQIILEGVASLPEREQTALQMAPAGRSQREIAEQLHISSTRAQQIFRKIGISLRKYATAKLWSTRMAERRMARTCSIVQTGPATEEALTVFDHYINFLAERYGVRTFYIGHGFAESDYMATLAQRIGELKEDYRIIAVSADDIPLEDPVEPCAIDEEKRTTVVYTVEGVPGLEDDDAWGAVSYMIGQSSFCLCNLTAVPDVEKTKSLIANTKQAVLLDLNKM